MESLGLVHFMCLRAFSEFLLALWIDYLMCLLNRHFSFPMDFLIPLVDRAPPLMPRIMLTLRSSSTITKTATPNSQHPQKQKKKKNQPHDKQLHNSLNMLKVKESDNSAEEKSQLNNVGSKVTSSLPAKDHYSVLDELISSPSSIQSSSFPISSRSPINQQQSSIASMTSTVLVDYLK